MRRSTIGFGWTIRHLSRRAISLCYLWDERYQWNIGLGIGHTKTAVHKFVLKVGAELGSVTMKIPSFFMGKIIVTLFLLADNPCGMKPSVTMSSVLLRHPSSALFLKKCRKCSVSAVYEGWVQMNPLMNPVGSKAAEKLNCINAVVFTHNGAVAMIQVATALFYYSLWKIPWYKAKSEVSGFKCEPANLAFFVYGVFGQ